LKAKCIQNKYSKRGSQVKSVTFFYRKGKVYDFTDYSFAINYYGLGNYEAINEQGIGAVMSKKHFEKYFEWV